MRSLRSVLAALALALGVSVAASQTPAAGADSFAARAAACPGSDRVTVVVDFGTLPGGTQVRCTSGNPSTGLDALTKAGFSYGFRPNFPGMVCTIDNKPNPCNGAPPDAYWAYWYAERGGSWTYSSKGAASRKPTPGSVEGWAFGDGSSPSVSPPPPPAPAPTTTRPPPTSPTSQPPGSGEPPPPPGPDEPGDTGGRLTPPVDGQTEDPTTGAATPSATTPFETGQQGEDKSEPPDSDTGDADDTDSSDGTDGRDGDGNDGRELSAAGASTSSGGGLAGVVIGAVSVIALVTAAAWELRRRRTST